MRTHPVFLCLEGRPCVVIGGDEAAVAKASACLRAGAAVTLIAVDVAPPLATWACEGRIRHLPRGYRPGDLAGAALVYASTRDAGLVAQLAAEAGRERAWLNVIDTPDACTFIAPAVVDRGELQIAIGTGGASPGLAAGLRREFEARIGPEYGPFVTILGAVRRRLAADPARAAARGQVVTTLLASPLLDLLRQGERGEVDALLARVAGEECTLAGLGIALEARA